MIARSANAGEAALWQERQAGIPSAPAVASLRGQRGFWPRRSLRSEPFCNAGDVRLFQFACHHLHLAAVIVATLAAKVLELLDDVIGSLAGDARKLDVVAGAVQAVTTA